MSYDLNISTGKGTKEEQLRRLKEAMVSCDAVLIGAGSGLSTSAGLTYSGERFRKYFFDFAEKYGIRDIYSGGFYPFPDEETRWAWWARHAYFNRYITAPKPVYPQLLSLVKDKDYFVLTTNVDHQFQLAGFDKKRLFYTQGDYGLFQSVDPSNRKTYDNEAWVMRAMEAQGFVRNEEGVFEVPADGKILMRIPSSLIPACPDDNGPVTMNLRGDDSFVEDEGWNLAAKRYDEYLDAHEHGRILYLELGVGGNTPVIIKFPFWKMTMANPEALYACLNCGEAYCPRQIEDQAICIDDDIGETLRMIDR